MTHIYLIRHCESEGNACRRTQAHVESIVTAKGYRQNEMLRRRFIAVPIDAIYSSDSYRSIMTVKPIADERGLTVRVRLMLREVTTGVWEDMAWGDIIRQYPKEHYNWQNTPWNMITPGGSTFQQVSDRLICGLRRIAQEVGDGTALAVSHSCSIKAALCTILGKPMTEVLDLGHGDNTSVSLLHVDQAGNISVEFMNDSSHLPAHLQRAWTGMAGSAINMGFDPVQTDTDFAKLVDFARMDYIERSGSSGGFDGAAYEGEARALLARHPKFIALALLGGRHVGFVRIGEDPNLPGDCGLLERHYILPELRGKGFSCQMFGYAACVIRYAYKLHIVLPIPVTEEEKQVAEQFLFAPLAGLPEYLTLDLFPPTLELHMLA